jgi:O-acetyl-ADP-ribose deacetylase
MIARIHGKTVEVIEGDITDYDGDSIVNAANNNFWMGGGVAGAIKRMGGQTIEHEAMKQGPKPVGESVITSAGSLRAKHVIHAAVMGEDLSTSSAKILQATRSALKLADMSKIKSIAFPALGTGVGGFPMEEAAQIMIGAACEFLRAPTSLERVTFVLFDHEAYNIFSAKLKGATE